MTRQQKILLGVLGGLVVVLAIVVGIAALTKSGDKTAKKPTRLAISDQSTTLPVDSTTTTVKLLPVDTTPPTTVGSTTTSSAAPTTTAAPKPALTGAGAVLVAPSSTTTRGYDGSSCQQLADPAPWSATCDSFNKAKAPELIWMLETSLAVKPKTTTGHRAYVWRAAGAAGAWTPVLQMKDDNGDRFTDLNVRVADLVGDGGEEAVFGFHNVGSGSILSVDVVRGPGKVVVHRDLAHGSARVSPGQLDTWSAVYAAGEANCCPSKYEHAVIRYSAAAFRIVSSEMVQPSAVPPSQL